MASTEQALLIDPALLKKIERLELVSRRLYQGGRSGSRKSRSRGSGMEFADHREYSPGDDFRAIDWNVYARLDELIVKTFETEQNLNVSLLVDTSASMGFGNPTKLQFAASLAAALAYLSLVNEDGIGITSIADTVGSELSSSRQNLSPARIFDFCSQLAPAGGTRFEETIKAFAFHHKQPGLLLLISDFWSVARFDEILQPLVYAGYDLCGVQVLAPEELAPDFAGEMDIVDSETRESIPLTVRGDTREKYQANLAHFLRQIEQALKTCHARFVRVTTDLSVERVLMYDLRNIGLVKERGK